VRICSPRALSSLVAGSGKTAVGDGIVFLIIGKSA
jgi:hypothetical protein